MQKLWGYKEQQYWPNKAGEKKACPFEVFLLSVDVILKKCG